MSCRFRLLQPFALWCHPGHEYSQCCAANALPAVQDPFLRKLTGPCPRPAEIRRVSERHLRGRCVRPCTRRSSQFLTVYLLRRRRRGAALANDGTRLDRGFWRGAGHELELIRKNFGDYEANGSCTECTLDATVRKHRGAQLSPPGGGAAHAASSSLSAILLRCDPRAPQLYTMSASYYSIMQAFGYSEPKLWLQGMAQPVFLQLLSGIQSALAGVAAVPSARAMFPGLQGNITITTALTQWCAA